MMKVQHAGVPVIPTSDMAVRTRLRRLGEPATLFGERQMERCDRLRLLTANIQYNDEEEMEENTVKVYDEEEATQYPFYTEGSKELINARTFIAKFSLPRAAQRLQNANRKSDWGQKLGDARWVLDCREIGDDRPLSGCSFSHDGTLLTTCSLSGVAKVWSMPHVKKISALKGHRTSNRCLVSPVSVNILATASADCTAKLWNTEGTMLQTFQGHLDRLARVGYHPSGKYLATASFDKTWRLWDIETGTELLLQEGHSRSVYGISFHPDGSLAASSGLDSLARVWDLRTGRSVLALEGHAKSVIAVSFSPDGYHLATGSEDNTCRIWDLRKKESMYTIPAHSNLISQVKFEPQDGSYLVTSSYDLTAKVWSSRDFRIVKTLSGHKEKVTSLDITMDGKYIASVGYDRAINLWSSSLAIEEKCMDTD